MAHACHVNVFWLAGGWTAELQCTVLLCVAGQTLLCLLVTCVHCIGSLLNLCWIYSRDRVVPRGRVDKRLRASVPYVLSVKQTQGTTNCVWGGKTNWEHFFGGLCGACCCTCWPPVWPVSPLTSQQIGVTIALLTTIIGVISVNQTWAHEWDILPISLQVSGGGGVVCLITQCVQDTDWWQAIIFYNPRLSPQLICTKKK